VAPWGSALSAIWRMLTRDSVARRLDCPSDVRVIAVGGATLGGSGKTPLAIACAHELASAGTKTALVGHAYRARPDRVRVVGPTDPIDLVGDEALVAARALAGCTRARVVVGPTRAAAVAFAGRDSDVLVLDGVAQTKPNRADLALLAVDEVEPWGRTSKLPPCGDLRAPISALLRACDAVVPLTDAPFGSGGVRNAEASSRVWPARVEGRGAWLSTPARMGTPGHPEFLPWEKLRCARVGVVAALARPDRIVRWLVRRGVRPCAIVRAPDHGPFGLAFAHACRSAAGGKVDVWVATEKCAVHVADALLGAPLAVMEYRLALHPELRAHVREVAPLP
jgi:tetraacyldisaccharide 4'-kinase